MTEKTVTEAQAAAIFGERRFLSAEKVVRAWNKLIEEGRGGHAHKPIKVPDNVPIPYSEATLKELGADNRWYLIYDPGFSPRENREIVGTDPEKQPCHRADNDWWLAEREDFWAGAKEDPGYRLFTMEGLFPLDNAAKDWDWQDEQVKAMGEAYERASTRLIANACISCFLVNQERHFESTYNFGPEMDADYCFLVTNFEQQGLSIGHWLRNDWGGYWVSGLATCVARKPDT
jgi:hypothetical protein